MAGCVGVAANGMDGSGCLYPHPGMGECEARVAERAGLATLVLAQGNARDVRSAAERLWGPAQNKLRVLGVSTVAELMGLLAPMLILGPNDDESQSRVSSGVGQAAA